MKRNVSLLVLCQALLFMANMTMISTSPLVGLQLAPMAALATLPFAMQFLASLLTTLPASLLMRRMGRSRGLALGALAGIASGLLGVYAVLQASFVLFCLAGFLYGVFAAFASYYRFAAADAADRASGGAAGDPASGDARRRAQAISLVLAGGVVAAFIGPELAKASKDWLPSALFAGCYLAVAAIALFSFLVLLLLDLPPVKAEREAKGGRPLREIFGQGDAILAVTAAVVGYVTMNLLMTATPLAMDHVGHLFESTTFVIQWHVVGMFAPSFVTGKLIARFGERRIIATGIALLMLCVVVNLTGVALPQFTTSLILLGIGWNFAFIGGTSLLTRCYTPAEKATVQGLNDVVLFGLVTLSAVSAGALHQWIGWSVMNLAVLPALAIVLALVMRSGRRVAAAA